MFDLTVPQFVEIFCKKHEDDQGVRGLPVNPSNEALASHWNAAKQKEDELLARVEAEWRA